MDVIAEYIPAATLLTTGCLVLVMLQRLNQAGPRSDNPSLLLQLAFWVGALALLVALIAALPMDNEIRGQIISLLGVVLTAMIALASTTFVANAMAGLMLQATQPFRPGDFIETGGVFGQVTRSSLVSTRLQTETRDFANLPNLLLVTQPLTVLHREGTIIQAEISLGYDVHHATAEPLLLTAARQAGLEDPYVLVLELLDHAVVYRAAGFLKDVNSPLSARSRLRREMLDAVHGAGLEVTSPSVVAQRQQPGDSRTVPPRAVPKAVATPEKTPETRIFDSGNAAATQEALKDEIESLERQIKEQKASLKELTEGEKVRAEGDLQRLEEALAQAQEQYESGGK